jgi:hypothetical protein
MPDKKHYRTCIYCGRAVGHVKKGEHVIPEALGGALTIKNVCGSCNNTYSTIDTELCSRSPLSIVASQVINAHLWQVWDVDHTSNNLLVEARPDWTNKSFIQYPQIIFERSGIQLRGDFEEVRHFGHENFALVMSRCARRAFQHAEAGERKWIHLEKIAANENFSEEYRLPPRLFSRHSLADIGKEYVCQKRTSFIMRFETQDERRFALNALSNWNVGSNRRSNNHFRVGIGSRLPPMRCFFEKNKVYRGLAKIAFNVLSHCCSNTPVDLNCFPDAVRLISGDRDLQPKNFRQHGFVCASDVQTIRADSNCHSFRLMYMDGIWHVYSAFFGGRIGAYFSLAGPNGESWRCADVYAPLNSAHWNMECSPLLQPLNCTIEWADLTRMVPSVEIINPGSQVQVTPISCGRSK